MGTKPAQRRGRRLKSFGMLVAVAACGLVATPAAAFTASKVWYEFLATGVIRVNVAYTVPELKEVRESHVEFRNRKDAEALYWDLLRGADFFPTDPKLRRFVQQAMQPDPW